MDHLLVLAVKKTLHLPSDVLGRLRPERPDDGDQLSFLLWDRMETIWHVDTKRSPDDEPSYSDDLNWDWLKPELQPMSWEPPFVEGLFDKVDAVVHPGIRARLLEALWEARPGKITGNVMSKLLAAHFDWATTLLFPAPPEIQGYWHAGRARRIASMMKKDEEVARVDTMLNRSMQAVIGEHKHWSTLPARVLLEATGGKLERTELEPQTLQQWHDQLLDAADDEATSWLLVETLELARGIRGMYDRDVDSKEYARRQVRDLVELAEAELQKPERALVAAVHLSQALQIGKRAGLPEQELRSLNERLREVNDLASKNMKEFRFEVPLPDDMAEQFQHREDRFVEHASTNPEEALRGWALVNCPRVEAIRKAFDGGTALIDLMSTYSIRGDRAAGLSGRELRAMQGTIDTELSLYLPAFARGYRRIVDTVDRDAVKRAICDSWAAQRMDVVGIEAGIDAVENKDYLAAAYILPPQLEMLIRNLVTKAGGKRTVFKEGKQLEATLHALVLELAKLGPEREAEWLAMLISDPSGANPRNNLLHGIYPPSQIDATVAMVLLKAMLLVATLGPAKG